MIRVFLWCQAPVWESGQTITKCGFRGVPPSIPNGIGVDIEIQRQCPSSPKTEEEIFPFCRIFHHRIKIEIPSVLREPLCHFQADVKIDAPIPADQLVSDEFVESQTIGQPVISFCIRAGHLRHRAIIILDSDFVLEQSGAQGNPQSGSLCLAEGKKPTAIQPGVIAPFFDPQRSDCQIPPIDDIVVQQVNQNVFFDCIAEEVIPFCAKYPAVFLGHILRRKSNIGVDAKPVAHISSGNLYGVTHRNQPGRGKCFLRPNLRKGQDDQATDNETHRSGHRVKIVSSLKIEPKSTSFYYKNNVSLRLIFQLRRSQGLPAAPYRLDQCSDMDFIPMVDLRRQYSEIRHEINDAIARVLESTGFINGKEVGTFSSQLAEWLQCRHVIPCANGTDAIQIALMSLGLRPGDEVITTPFTFVATVEVIALLGLRPVFVDIDRHSFLMNLDQVAAKCSPAVKAIVPVHLFGQCCDMEKLMDISRRTGIPVVEDNAQAIGAQITLRNGSNLYAGTIGQAGTTSFFPSKNLGGYGDGGAIFTQDDGLASEMAAICNHGSSIRYYHDMIGVNSRLDTLQAAILEVKLAHLDAYIARRQAAAARYDALLSELPGITPPARLDYSTHVYHQYTIIVDEDRAGLQQYLQEKGIASAVYYPVPLHLQKAYSHYGYGPGDFPVAESLSGQVLSLPIYPEIEADQQRYIAEQIAAYLSVKPANY